MRTYLSCVQCLVRNTVKIAEMLAEEELSRLLGEKVRVAEKAARLYQTAARGGRDNITVLLVQVV